MPNYTVTVIPDPIQVQWHYLHQRGTRAEITFSHFADTEVVLAFIYKSMFFEDSTFVSSSAVKTTGVVNAMQMSIL